MFLIPPRDPWTHECWLKEKHHQTLETDGVQISPPGNCCPAQKVLSHTWHSNCLPEDISSFIQARCFRIVGNMVDPVNPMDLGTLQPFN